MGSFIDIEFLVKGLYRNFSFWFGNFSWAFIRNLFLNFLNNMQKK